VFEELSDRAFAKLYDRGSLWPQNAHTILSGEEAVRPPLFEHFGQEMRLSVHHVRSTSTSAAGVPVAGR
jgi:hypothetical protein